MRENGKRPIDRGIDRFVEHGIFRLDKMTMAHILTPGCSAIIAMHILSSSPWCYMEVVATASWVLGWDLCARRSHKSRLPEGSTALLQLSKALEALLLVIKRKFSGYNTLGGSWQPTKGSPKRRSMEFSPPGVVLSNGYRGNIRNHRWSGCSGGLFRFHTAESAEEWNKPQNFAFDIYPAAMGFD